MPALEGVIAIAPSSIAAAAVAGRKRKTTCCLPRPSDGMRQQISRPGEVTSDGIEHVSRRPRNPKKAVESLRRCNPL